MRVLLLVISSIIYSLCASGQGGSSFYFNEPQPVDVRVPNGFVGEVVGEYRKEENKRVKFYVTSDSVFYEFPVIMSQSVAEIEAEGKYEIKGELIFGIHKHKGLPVRVFNDTAIFVLYQKELMFSVSKGGVLREHNGVFYLNKKQENGKWITTALSVRGDDLYLHTLDHSLVMNNIKTFNSYTEKVVDGIVIYSATPTTEQMTSFYDSKGFKDKVKYSRVSDN